MPRSHLKAFSRTLLARQMQTFRALLCDLDGTLIDTAPVITDTLNGFLAEHGRTGLPLATVRDFIGDGAARLVARAFAATGDSVDGDRLGRLARDFSDRLAARPPGPGDVFPGVPETLAVLRRRGTKLAVCSNKPAAAVGTALQSAGIAGCFGAFVGGDSAAERKPSPLPVHAALSALGVPAEAAVMVGDNEVDVATARAAGLPIVIVRYGYARIPLSELGADRLIDSFAGLPAALEPLAAQVRLDR